jgi:hypothetical protein
MHTVGVDDSTVLLERELTTLWITDHRGRLERVRPSDPEPVPLLVVATARDALVWACSTVVPDDLAADIGEALDADRPHDRTADVGWSPTCAPRLLELVGQLGPVGNVARGPSFLFSVVPEPHNGIECWLSTEVDAQRLSGRMPERDRQSLAPPWAVAVVDGQVASVCETARSAPDGVEAGVWTYESHRQQGLATAATAAWARLVAGRTVFYSTSYDNRSSQRVAQRLGLSPLGHWWTAHPAQPG